MTGVLDGVRVVEVSMWAMVPAAGAILAEWGADVVKVEGPDGDPLRGLVSAGLSADGPQFTWEMWNRGKRAIALDLKLAEGRDVLFQLVAEADVFLTSVLPGQRAALGLDLESVRAANPSIVYAAATGYGAEGPEADKGGYDAITFWARSGMAAGATRPGADVTGMPAVAFGDSLSGLSLAGGVAAALVRKARTGEGAVVEGSLLGTALWAMQMSLTGARAAGLDVMPMPSRDRPFNVLVNTYRTADDRWLQLCMMQADRFWPGFCQAIGRDDLIDDPRFVDAATRDANVEECVKVLDAVFGERPLSEWKERLAGQDGQWDVIQQGTEVLDDPQVVANRFAQAVDYGDGNQLTLVGSPVRFDQTPPTIRPAPEFAGDTDEVLASIGWDMDAVIEAKIAGAVI